MPLPLIKQLSVQNELGEGIQWHALSQSLWWTDIHNSKLYSYSPSADQISVFHMPDRVGCFAFTPTKSVLIVAFAKGIARYHLETKEITWLSKPEQHNPGNRFNDGRVDRNGSFWAGTLVEDAKQSIENAKLYQLNQDLTYSPRLTNIQISNGLCFSPNGELVYHADSPTRSIYRYEITASGDLTAKTRLAITPEGVYPDGACIDVNGNLWSAQWGGGRVVQYSSTGEILSQVDIPVAQPSCVAIGGPNMDWLCVTSAREGLSQNTLEQQKSAGDVFIYQLPAPIGLEESLCTTLL
ncbi:SMP-30/gluconolactonase/LRE family protein [Thalassotalea euphylliae]|uniref:SMP-30/gluconolactonase/LRE family protein n=1 Tax=Thalassotalea euphylliae TaxID=1655234 RepID=UPI003624EBED